MEAVVNSFLLVALSEMGDKTQILAFILASRFKKPWPVFWGILVATVANHLLASWAGDRISLLIPPLYLKVGLALTFFAFAIWVLIPDKQDDDQKPYRYGPFLTTVVVFFLAEMGDKTQLATVALAARYQDILSVTMGSTLGMMLSNGLAVFFGDKIATKINMTWMHRIAAVLFIAFGIWALVALPG
jgi:putative Ca2+/H+ antiporter (TMEM165/GDT1 family)